MESTTKVVGFPSGRSRCLREDDAIGLLSAGSVDVDAAALLSHVEICSSCRRLVGAAARVRVATSAPERPFSTLAPGDRLGGRYEIVRLLARGGMGEVYESRDDLLGEVVALKTIVLSALDNQRALSALKAEVQLARKVSHRNVCRILEFGMHVGERGRSHEVVPFFTMELLRGETLRQRLQRVGKLSVEEALPIVLDVVEGLAAIHAAGIVHRDLKPENVFLLSDGQRQRAVVMDFGLARPLDLSQSLASSWGSDEREAARPAGTLEYMSPEQLRGAAPTATFDIYALGTIMFEMLAGTRPFTHGRAGSWAATLERLDRAARPLSGALPGADPTWERVIARCLARAPDGRHGSIGEVAAALLPRPGLPESGRAGAARSIPRIAVVSGFLLASAVVTGTVVLRPRTASAPPPPAAAPVAAVSAAPPSPAPVTWIATRSGDGEVRVVTRSARSGPVPSSTLRRAPAGRGGAGAGSQPVAPAGVAPAAPPREPAVIAPEPRDTAGSIERAEELMVAGEGAAACALGEQAARKTPAAAPVHRFLGKCYMRLSDPTTARRHYRRYLELAPDAPDRVFVRAIVEQER